MFLLDLFPSTPGWHRYCLPQRLNSRFRYDIFKCKLKLHTYCILISTMVLFLFLALRTVRGVFTVTFIQRERSEGLGRISALHSDPALTGILTLNISVTAPVVNQRSDYSLLNPPSPLTPHLISPPSQTSSTSPFTSSSHTESLQRPASFDGRLMVVPP